MMNGENDDANVGVIIMRPPGRHRRGADDLMMRAGGRVDLRVAGVIGFA